MVTNKEAIYQVKALSEQAQLSDDNGWSDTWIFNELLKYRARIISQKTREKMFVSEFNYQESPFIALDAITNDTDGKYILYKSRTLLPKSVIPIKSIFNPLNNVEYPIEDISRMRYRRRTRFPYINNKDVAYISDEGKGSNIYIASNNPLLTEIKASGIFYNPLEIQTYPDPTGKVNFPCRSYYDYEFKLDDELRTTINEMMLDYFYKLKFGPNDRINNNLPND